MAFYNPLAVTNLVWQLDRPGWNRERPEMRMGYCPPSALSSAAEVTRPDCPLAHAEVVAWVRASCEAQGLPEKITDQTILRKVAVILRPGLAGLPVPKRRKRWVQTPPAPDRGQTR
jgi:hypothetical protein